jgi:hypothetical protein
MLSHQESRETNKNWARYNTKVVEGQNMSFLGNVAMARISENSCKECVPGSYPSTLVRLRGPILLIINYCFVINQFLSYKSHDHLSSSTSAVKGLEGEGDHVVCACSYYLIFFGYKKMLRVIEMMIYCFDKQ